MASHDMLPLGHVRTGTRRIADRAVTAVLDHGQVALFLSTSTGEAAAVPYTSPEYDRALQRHAAHLVGIYCDSLDDGAWLYEQLLEDLAVHVRGERRMAA